MSKFNITDLLAKHKKERKDLQAQIQSLKKSCYRGDKKRKKEVAEQIYQLEQDLDERQTKELCDIEESETENEAENYGEDNQNGLTGEGNVKEVRVTKAQKRRNKKVTANKEREERIRVQEEEFKKGPRLIETAQINDILKELGLKMYSIPADGNCLYCSINHQLQITGRKEYTVSELRKITANYMREHKDEILPFMSNDIDEVFTEEQYEKYCSKVANTTEWGGQIEIVALSNILKCPIKVIQANSLPAIQGEEFNTRPLILTYHRHLYKLGEHYNSTIPV